MEHPDEHPLKPGRCMVVCILADAAEESAPIRETVEAYLHSYMDDGWSRESAETMAVQYHAVICNGLRGGHSDE